MKKEEADLLRGMLELLILRLLRSRQLNGWEIMQQLQVASGDALSVTPGALYPALHRLENRGLISAAWRPSENNRKARYYRLTRAGHPPTVLSGAAVVGVERARQLFESAYDEHARRLAKLYENL